MAPLGGWFSRVLSKSGMPDNSLRLVVGLGNPGSKYAATRHNAGFMAVDAVAQAFNIKLDHHKFNVTFGRGRVKGIAVILALPQAFMNASGPPIRRLADYFRITGRDMLVVYDDIDLPFERLRIKAKGGHGGHKGVRSIMDAFGGGDFARLRIGIGRSTGTSSVTDHVLGRFSPQEQDRLADVIEQARDAVVTLLCKGTKEGMNKFNVKRTTISR
jgi:PTH1 family peptidyl-tRNA hydrolase